VTWAITTRTLPSSDFYGLERTLEPSELGVLHAVRTFMRDEVEPIINDHWTRAKFPFQILDGFRQLDIAGLPYEGYGCPAREFALDVLEA
jgi:glutaryl-CoA dehydrogenase